ncbi:MAG: RluA family pseudouridine synthase [Chlamydiales bacterium]|nr:RluA family pseudouridine synthase [Chlamydiia bacterium]MCP5508471.1 RluA family pseudouridine synthase [Chlamydiales bacterium]
MRKEWEVCSSEEGYALVDFLREKLPEFSGKKVKQAIDAGLCEVNGLLRDRGSYRLSSGDCVTIILHNNDFQPSSAILWENEAVIVFNKPAGITSETFQAKRKVILAHRLDKQTSGVIICAKDHKTEEFLIDQFRQRKVCKEYLAIVDGPLSYHAGHIENYLGIIKQDGEQKYWGAVSSGKGKLAITDWEELASGDQAALILAKPVTGRTHQIRVHLLGIGYPILGDVRYCRQYRCDYRPPRLMLHSHKISFVDPISNKLITVTAPLPDDMKNALNALRIDYENSDK